MVSASDMAPADEKRQGLCPHFGECGGCTSQDAPYDDQLARKERALRELFRTHWGCPVPVVPSPAIWHYRNRLDLSFARKFYDQPPPKGFTRETVLGFKRKGRWFHPFDVHECRIGPVGVELLLNGVRRWAAEQGLHGFDSRTHEGLLKLLLVREGKRSGRRMVVLITGDGAIDAPSFVRAVQSAWPVTSIHHAISQSPAGVASAERTQLLYGTETIEERLDIRDDGETRGIRIRLSPFSFFQTNTLAAEHLYGIVRRWVKGLTPKVLYDLYGGGGEIALVCADLVERIVSVDNYEAASEDGRFNAAANGAGSIEFVTAKVEDYFREMALGRRAFEDDAVVVVDPPRAGLHPKALQRLLMLRPPHLIYLSCKPEVFARCELAELAQCYRLEGLEAVDLFPHTAHVEVVARLTLTQR